MEYVPDEKDLLILEALRDHGDYTVRQIAKKTLLPPTTIHNRIARLRKAGIIRKFTVELDDKKLGLMVGAYLLVSADLKLLKRKKRSLQKLGSDIRKIAGIEKVDIFAGGTGAIVKLRVKDIDELDRTVAGIQLLEGVTSAKMIVLHD